MTPEADILLTTPDRTGEFFLLTRGPRIKYWGLRLAEFGAVQVAVQALTAMAGILIVRSLSKPEYALFAIANSMQAACNLLAYVGIGVGFSSIGGRVWNDRFRFGQLLNTAISLRRRFVLPSLGVTLPVTAWMLWRNGASPMVSLGLLLAFTVAVIALLYTTVWGASLQLHGQFRRLQKLDFGNAVLRVAMIGGLALSGMNVVLVTLAGVVSNWAQFLFQRRWVREFADPAAPVNDGDRYELMRLSKQSLPNTLFFCFQGQVTLLILTFFGNPSGVADWTALGRIASLFAIFSVTFGTVLVPRFARCQNPARLRRLYWLLVGGTVVMLLPLVFVAFLFPAPLLWLLGGKYASLERECGWVIAAGCIAQIGGIMWTLNCSRAWLFIQPIVFIPMVLASQVVCAAVLDLRQFHNILILNLVGAAVPVWIYLVDALIGLSRSERVMKA